MSDFTRSPGTRAVPGYVLFGPFGTKRPPSRPPSRTDGHVARNRKRSAGNPVTEYSWGADVPIGTKAAIQVMTDY